MFWGFLFYHREHIYRHHLLPLHCSRCLDNFKSDALLSAHQRINPPCDVNSQSESPEGVSGSQISVLKARKKNPNVSETDKWKEMYRVIFPEDDEKDMPSPCKSSFPLFLPHVACFYLGYKSFLLTLEMLKSTNTQPSL